jgi:exopolyphosphatase / guanosine-5'-triphosphate,3'-diphosphate pyrophosphatase
MNLASIDIGTNAVLLLLMGGEGSMHEILDRSTITRLGQGLLRSRRLSPAAMERTARVLVKYREVIDDGDARVVRCFGTSALREAANGIEFVAMVRARAGLDIEVFSEYQEAYYTYLSVRNDNAIEGQDLVIVDIGGGSTEIIKGDREEFHDFVSLPVGTVKLTERFIKHDPPLISELERLAGFVREKLRPGQSTNPLTVVGMAGTVTTLAMMIQGLAEFDKRKIHGFRISVPTLDAWIKQLAAMAIAQRKSLLGMEPGREDLLLQGMVLMREILASLEADSFVVSTYGARYGVILEEIERSHT